MVLIKHMDLLLSLAIGLGLSAACGFRIFVPLLVMSIAANAGHGQLASSFSWIGSTEALVALSVATALEVGAYYIPWLDNFLDTVATPAAVVAGSVVTASMLGDMSPLLKWSLGIIAGGGVAGAVQATTVAARGFSLAGTGGLANPLVASVELGGSIVTAALAIIAPFVAIGLAALVVGLLLWKVVFRKRATPPLLTEAAPTV
jgi:hypothetical protein